MARKPRILFNLLGDQRKASSRVRGWWVGEELELRGFPVTYRIAQSKRDVIKLAAAILSHDVVVFQKTYGRYDPWLVRLARSLGRTCYFDIDDAPSRGGKQPAMRNAQTMMRECDMVWAGSPALKDLASADARNVALIPSAIRLQNYIARSDAKAPGTTCLGWIGNGAHYADDLIAQLAQPLAQIAQTQPIKFRIVGACGIAALYDTFGAIDGLETDFIDTVDWSSPRAVGDAIAPFDIGLYPLDSGPFNDYKCGFKALEYMALGIPVVASNVAANRDIVVDGKTGFLVENQAGWIEAISTLAGNPEQCLAMGSAGRERMEKSFSVPHVADLIEGFLGHAKPNPEAELAAL